jgi:hypothetical protein
VRAARGNPHTIKPVASYHRSTPDSRQIGAFIKIHMREPHTAREKPIRNHIQLRRETNPFKVDAIFHGDSAQSRKSGQTHFHNEMLLLWSDPKRIIADSQARSSLEIQLLTTPPRLMHARGKMSYDR